jgi:hypothetical protein
VLLAAVLLSAAVQAQEPANAAQDAASSRAAASSRDAAPVVESVSPVESTLPRAFRKLSLGMSLEALKAALAADELFVFRGDRDVSLLPQSNQTLIETTGLSFVRRAFFQLKDDVLFMMAFSLDPDKVDHYSVFQTFVADYGEPESLDPTQAVWLSDDVRISIERPLTVKYIDRAIFDGLAQDARAKESRDAVLRKEFLDGF